MKIFSIKHITIASSIILLATMNYVQASQPIVNQNIYGVQSAKNDVLNKPYNSNRGGLILEEDETMRFENQNLNFSNHEKGISIPDRATVSIINDTEERKTLTIDNNTQEGITIENYDSGTSEFFSENMDISISNNGKDGIAMSGADLYLYGRNTGVDSEKSILKLENNGGYGILSKETNGSNNISIHYYNIDYKGNTFIGSNGNNEIVLHEVNIKTSDESNLIEFLSGENNTMYSFKSHLEGAIKTANDTDSDVMITMVDWKMLKDSNISTLNMHSSYVDLRGNDYNTLRVNRFILADTQFYINTFFDGDGNKTDKIIIDEELDINNGEPAIIYVTSTGGTAKESASDGIMVVDLTNATIKEGKFELYGGVVDGGFYEYELHQALDENWYLKSNGVVTSVVDTMVNLPPVAISIAQTGMNELNKRMGELRNFDMKKSEGVWVRSYTKNLKINDTIDSRTNIYGFEGGYDHKVYSNNKQAGYVGIMAGYMYSDKLKSYQKNGERGNGDIKTPSFGVYGTFLNNKGWFIDATYRAFFTSMDVSSKTAQGSSVTHKQNRLLHATSIETGFRKEIIKDQTSKYTIEPKIEMQYIYSGRKSFKVNNGNYLEYGTSQSLLGRLSINIGYSKKLESGTILEPFVKMGVIEEFDGKTDIRYMGENLKSNISGTSFEFGGGMNAILNNTWGLYSEVVYEKGSVVESFSTNIGIRYNW